MNDLMLTLETSLQARPAMNAALLPGQVALWSWDLDHEGWRSGGHEALLSRGEWSRMAGMRFERERKRYLAAHAGLRILLGAQVDDSPESLEFELNRFGKPRLAARHGAEALHFSLSHSGGRAMLAATRGAEIGVDIEHMRRDFDAAPMAEIAFNARERDWFNSLVPTQRHQGFFKIWTLRESVIKACGESLATGLKLYSVIPDSVDSADVVNPQDGAALTPWRLRSFNPWPEFAAAVAWKHPGGSEYSLVDLLELEYADFSRFFGATL